MTRLEGHSYLWIVAPIAVVIGVAAVAFHLYESTNDAFSRQIRTFEQRSFLLETAGTFSRAFSTLTAGVTENDASQVQQAVYKTRSAIGHLRDGTRHNERYAVFADDGKTRELLAELEHLATEFEAVHETIAAGRSVDSDAFQDLRQRSVNLYRECRAVAVEFEVMTIDLHADLQRRGSNAALFLTALVVALAGLAVALAIYVRRQRKTQQHLAIARHQAENANQAKSEFLANMSHEIRTPMTAILGFAENLSDPEITPGERQHCVQTIQRNGDYLLGIINDILDLSKIEAGKMTVEREPVDAREILGDVVGLMTVRAEAKGLHLDVAFEGPLPELIHTDPTRLRQILINLVANAIKFTEIGRVKITASMNSDRQNPSLQFVVTDTGIGMTREQSGRLFRPFTQADMSMTRRYGGTGLGLTISRRFAKLLGGDLTIVQSAPSVGTTFRASVTTGPLAGVRMVAKPQLTSRAVLKPTVTGTPLYGRRVLLAEDGPDNQVLISHVLKKAGAKVSVVSNGELAIAAVNEPGQSRPFDVILMDMQMPVLDGYAATTMLREQDYKGTILALTAHAMAGDRQKCLQAGCDGYATKPIDRARLIELILMHLESFTLA